MLVDLNTETGADNMPDEGVKKNNRLMMNSFHTDRIQRLSREVSQLEHICIMGDRLGLYKTIRPPQSEDGEFREFMVGYEQMKLDKPTSKFPVGLADEAAK